MDLYNLILTAKIQKGEGGGGDIDVDALNVTENGTYTASSGHAYNPVSVNVPIPSGYIQPTGTSSITENGIYNISSFASVDVNVAGGGESLDDFIEGKTVTLNTNASYIRASLYYRYAGSLETIYAPNVTSVGLYAFASCSTLKQIYCPEVTRLGSYAFQSCTSLSEINMPKLTATNVGAFTGCKSLMSIYLLSNSVASLYGSNAFFSTPMQYSSYTGSFGSIYVPASLVSDYKTATHWSYYADRITSYVE